MPSLELGEYFSTGMVKGLPFQTRTTLSAVTLWTVYSPILSSAGVFIRTGLTITTGERVASGLIWRFGSLDCVSDNAGCFADRPFPAGGSVISFGGHDVYVATVAPPRYPRQVLRCASPPPRAGRLQ